MICRADKDGKIVILNFDVYDAIMTRELQQFEKLDVSVDGSDTYLEKVGKDCNEVVVKLHAIGQGSPNFFVRGPHKLLLNSPRAT